MASIIKKDLLLTHCPICESDRVHYKFIKNGYPLCQCDDCSFMFLNPQPTDEVLSESNHKQNRSRAEKKNLLFLKQLLHYCHGNKGKILEIGCGNGDFLCLARDSGFEVSGIETFEAAGKIANERLSGDSVKWGDFHSLELPEDHYDFVCLFDQIECVRNPLSTLKKIRTILKQDGILFLTTSSLDSKSARSLKEKWTEFKVDHLNYFDSQTIQSALFKAGYKDIMSLPEGNFISVLAKKTQKRETPVLSIVLPVYNEVKTFPQLMAVLLPKEIEGLQKEIIIVESNSKDGTREEVLKYKDHPHIKIVLEEKPQGKGHAVREGLRHITGDFVIIQDGDLEYDINDYDQLLQPLLKNQKAFVLGSRHANGFKMREFEKQPLISFIMNFGQIFFTFLLNLFCGTKMKDPFTMYKVFRKDCIYNLEFKANRFDFDWEFVIKMIRKGYIPHEIPVNYRSRSFQEGKKVSFIKDPILWIIALLRFRFCKLYKNEF